jgi:transposase
MAHPGGRPTDYKDEYCQMVKDHMAKGYSFESFGALVGCHKQTLYNWQSVHPKFFDSVKEAFELCRLFWEEKGIDLVTGDSNGNATAWIFQMKNRFPEEWKDKKEVDNTHDFKNRPDWLDAAQ